MATLKTARWLRNSSTYTALVPPANVLQPSEPWQRHVSQRYERQSQQRRPLVPRIERLTIQGFRSFGPIPETIAFDAPMAVIWGANSEGKTSLAEALEFLMTGDIARRALLTSSVDEFEHALRNAHMPPDTDRTLKRWSLPPERRTPFGGRLSRTTPRERPARPRLCLMGKKPAPPSSRESG